MTKLQFKFVLKHQQILKLIDIITEQDSVLAQTYITSGAEILFVVLDENNDTVKTKIWTKNASINYKQRIVTQLWTKSDRFWNLIQYYIFH